MGFFCSFSECADTEQILEQQVLRARFLGSIFTSSQMRESIPGLLGEKRERYLCAVPSPLQDEVSLSFFAFSITQSLLPCHQDLPVSTVEV